MSTILVESMTDVLAQLATGTYEIRPGVAPVNDGHGRFSPGTPVAPVPDVLCSVQPLQGDDLVKTEDGDRLDAYREVYTAYPLQPADTAIQRAGDVVMIDSPTNGPGLEAFEVVEAFPWGKAAGVTRAVVRRQRR